MLTMSVAAAAGTVTPTDVADNVLRCIADSEAAQPPMRFFAFVDEADVRRQAAESTARRGCRPLWLFPKYPCLMAVIACLVSGWSLDRADLCLLLSII